MRTISLLSLLASFLAAGAIASNPYIWTSATPMQIHLVPEGLVVYGDFTDIGVTCSTVAGSSIFLPKTDENFDHKLSMALMAYAASKELEVLLETGSLSQCKIISAGGSIPVVHKYYWRLK